MPDADIETADAELEVEPVEVPEEVEVDADEASTENCHDCDGEGDEAVIEVDEAEFTDRVVAAIMERVDARIAALTLVTAPDETVADDGDEDPEPEPPVAEVVAEEEVEEELPKAAAAGDVSAPVSLPTVPLATKGDVEALEERMGETENQLKQLMALVMELAVPSGM